MVIFIDMLSSRVQSRSGPRVSEMVPEKLLPKSIDATQDVTSFRAY